MIEVYENVYNVFMYFQSWHIHNRSENNEKSHFSFTLFNLTINKNFYIDSLLMFNRIFNKGTQKLVQNKGVCLAI
jgi:hypothetical protein